MRAHRRPRVRQLRRLLALRITRTHVSPAPSASRDRLATFYLACADAAEVPEVASLAKTISKWQEPVISAVLTGYSNAKAEAHNRTAKLVARAARFVDLHGLEVTPTEDSHGLKVSHGTYSVSIMLGIRLATYVEYGRAPTRASSAAA